MIKNEVLNETILKDKMVILTEKDENKLNCK